MITAFDYKNGKKIKEELDKHYANAALIGAVMFLMEYVEDYPGAAEHKDIGKLVHVIKNDILKLELGYE